MFFPEQADVQLGHVSNGQAAADEEENLHKLVGTPALPGFLQEMDVFQNAFVQQALADVPAADGGNTADGQRTQQESNVQHRLATTEAPNIIQV